VIRAVVWKEFREQGLIGLTLLVLGSGVLVAAAALADPPTPGAAPADVIRFLGAGLLATLLLAVTAGMVCGGALFAAEREAGTIGFLESLPVSRWHLWQAKLAAGAVLVGVQVGAVVAVAAGLGLFPTVGWAVAVVVYALLAFCWGLYGSTLARTTLGSVGLAIPAASVAAFVFLFPILLFFQHPGTNLPRAEGALLFLGLMFVTPIVGSGLAFTRPDRDRAADDPTPALFPAPARRPDRDPGPPPAPGGRARARVGWKALVWLAARQLAGPGGTLSSFAIVFGTALLLPTMQPFLVWPALALAAGVLAGVTSFADEQANGTARFWGERRLPVGRAWAVKVVVFLGFAAWLVLLLALPLAARALVGGGRAGQGETTLSAVFRSLMFEDRNLGAQGWKYLLAPAAYGFAFGHLCGIVFRKAVVAAGVAVLLGGTAAALWLPSLLAGGVTHWQLWLPPVLVLATARLLMRGWASERQTTPGAAGTLAAGGVVAALALAAGLGYRATEVPDEGDGEADIRYVQGLLPFDANEGGRLFRTAAEQFAGAAAPAGGPFDRTGPLDPRRGPMIERVDSVPAYGFPPADGDGADPGLHAWMNQLYETESPRGRDVPWFKLAADAAGQPTGLYEHPQVTGTTAGAMTLENGRRMAVVLVAHGLRQQVLGDPGPFVDDLKTVLALGRTMRNGSVIVAVNRGNDVTRTALLATDRWLERLPGRPDLLRAALDAVLEDDRAVPTRVLPDGRVLPAEIPPRDHPPPAEFDPAPHLLAERYVTRELMKAPSQWLPEQLTPVGGDKEAAGPVVDLVTFGWSVPWERERTRRLVGLGPEQGGGARYRSLTRGRPGAGLLAAHNPSTADLAEHDRKLRVDRRAVALRLAVRLYQAERQTTPAALDDLVAAGYLPAVPADPYDGAPFRYRVAGPDGEALGPPPRVRVGPGPPPAPPPVSRAEPGQPILWSVGPNRSDDGGRGLPVAPGNPGSREDLVYLVPLPPVPR
jgi:hypothetical protein